MSDSADVWIGATTALVGAGVGSGVTLLVEMLRARATRNEARSQALLDSCADFTASAARLRSLSYELKDRPADHERARATLEEARVQCERLRLLTDRSTGEAARMVVRHLYAVWRVGLGEVDPRREEFEPRKPEQRLHDELTKLYVGVRRQVGVKNPENVFAALEEGRPSTDGGHI